MLVVVVLAAAGAVMLLLGWLIPGDLLWSLRSRRVALAAVVAGALVLLAEWRLVH